MRHVRSQNGFVVLLTTVAAFIAMGFLAFQSYFFASTQNRIQSRNASMEEAFLSGEIAAWGNTTVHGGNGQLVTMLNDYSADLPNGFQADAFHNDYTAGSPLNVLATANFDHEGNAPARNFLRRYNQQSPNLAFRSLAGDRWAYCGSEVLAGGVFQMCLMANEPPIAQNGVLNIPENTVGSGTLVASDPDGDPIFFRTISKPSHGTVQITNFSTGTYNYTPDPNFVGTDAFAFVASDGLVDSNTATITITVTKVNRAPLALDGIFSTHQNKSYSGVLSASDPDGDPIVFSVVNPPKGKLVLTNVNTGAFTYTPPLGMISGADTFTFQAYDGSLYSNVATESITVVDIAPVANNGSMTVTVNTPTAGMLSASDVNGNPLTYAIVSPPTKGTVVITNPSTGAFTYTANKGTSGTDTFTFDVTDGVMTSNVATETITINNPPPVANNCSATVTKNGTISGTVTATDPDGETLTFSLVSNGKLGTATLSSNGSYTYVAGGTTGTDAFTFEANDGTSNSNVASCTITITGGGGGGGCGVSCILPHGVCCSQGAICICLN